MQVSIVTHKFLYWNDQPEILNWKLDGKCHVAFQLSNGVLEMSRSGGKRYGSMPETSFRMGKPPSSTPHASMHQ